MTGMEAPAVLHYSAGQRFLPHYDFLDEAHPGHEADIAKGGQRVLTFLLSLNDDYEGGETSVSDPRQALSRPQRETRCSSGTSNRTAPPTNACCMPDLPPTLGEKWMLSQWIRGRF